MFYYMRFIFLLVGIFLLAPKMTHAYLDPGTGSFIFQVIIASFLAVVVSFKKAWLYIVKPFKKVKMFIDKIFSKKDIADK